MKKYRFFALILTIFLLISLFSAPAAAANESEDAPTLPEPTVLSDRICMAEAASGGPVFSKNADIAAAPASLTKIMTALLAVEAVERGEITLSENVTAGPDIGFDLISDGSSAGITSGETMTFEQFLYCAMVSSANEACNVIAQRVSGSVSAFVQLMNQRAAELGCTHTHFANTHGLPNESHYSSAHDMMLISKEAITHELFMTICNTDTYIVPATNSHEERTLQNTNGLTNPDSPIYTDYYFEYASGVKTGHTEAAGYCLVSTAAKNGVNYLLVVMGGIARETRTRVDYTNFSDSITLYEWAFENFSYRDVLKSTALIADIPVKLAEGTDTVTVRPDNPVRALLPNSDALESFEQQITIYSEQDGQELVAPIKAGEVLGEISIVRDGVVYGRSNLVAATNIELSYSEKFMSGLRDTLSNPVVIVIIVLVALLLVLYIVVLIKRRRAKKVQREYAAAASRQPRRTGAPRGRHESAPTHARTRQRRNTAESADEFFSDIEPNAKYSLTDDEFGFYSDKPKSSSAQSKEEKDYFDEYFGKK